MHCPSLHWNSSASVLDCGIGGCLFRIDIDPAEHVDLAHQRPTLRAAMLHELRQWNATTFSPHRGVPHMDAACEVATRMYGGFWGPFVFDGAE